MHPKVTDWELLRMTVRARRRTKAHSDGTVRCDYSEEEYSRLRVAVDGRLGECGYRHSASPSAEHVERAMRSARSGLPLSVKFGSAYPNQFTTTQRAGATRDDLAVSPGVLGVGWQHTSVSFIAGSGETLRWDHVRGHALLGDRVEGRGVPLALLDTTAPTDGTRAPRLADVVPAAEVVPARRFARGSAWLYGPLALSVVLAPRCATAVAQSSRIDPWPPASVIVSGLAGPPTDLEGTPRQPMILVNTTGTTTPIHTLADVNRSDMLTGHAGLFGLDIADLRVQADSVAQPPRNAAACFVVDARPLAGSDELFAYTALGSMPGQGFATSTMIVRLPRPLDLLREGQWVGPTYGGRRGWVSPWWETNDLVAATDVLHVEEAR